MLKAKKISEVKPEYLQTRAAVFEVGEDGTEKRFPNNDATMDLSEIRSFFCILHDLLLALILGYVWVDFCLVWKAVLLGNC